MRFKGYNFRRRKDIVLLSNEAEINGGYYARFGRVVPKGRIPGPDAEKARYAMWEDGSVKWAKPIKVTSYSRTNMAYGADGQIYVCVDGWCYTHRLRSAEDESMHWHAMYKDAARALGELRREVRQLKADQEAMV